MNAGLAIVGYGKMGRLIEQFAPEYGFDVRAKFDGRENLPGGSLSQQALRGVDVAVEFTSPDAAPENIRRLAAMGVNSVVGTTGWYDDLASVREAITKSGTGLVWAPNFSVGVNLFLQAVLVWAPNFSVGVNLFLQAVGHTAALFAKHPDYQAWGWEIHHSAKKDALSGTLKKLAEEMRAHGFNRTVNLGSNRAGAHPGTHEIGFDSPADTITLRHTARSREGFARGALRAARWVVGKKGLFEFREILGELS